MKIAKCLYKVPSLEDLEAFYCGILGMQSFETNEGLLVGYDTRQCLLEFQAGEYLPLEPMNDSLYWKIGITVRNLEAVVEELRTRGLSITDPKQFLDVGYLCHLRDPNGFTIELLQQSFEGNHRPDQAQAAHAIEAQAILAHITLRGSHISAFQELCERRLKMRLMSLQRIELPDRRFDLYFYGWSDETLPDPNVESIANREWLYARPYSLLEFQHLVTPPTHIVKPNGRQSGFTGLRLQNLDGNIYELSLADLTATQ